MIKMNDKCLLVTPHNIQDELIKNEIEQNRLQFESFKEQKYNEILREYKQLQNNWNELKEENKALLTLVEWFIECGMGFDNIASPDDMNWEEFEEESKNMGYTESLIYYAKKYNQLQELEQGKDES